MKPRKGLEFRDGKPVTGDDVIASLQRWGKRDAMGSALVQFVSRTDSPTLDALRISWGEACGFVLQALGKPSSNVPFILPKPVADTGVFKQIDDHTGSGPYDFKKKELKTDDQTCHTKFVKYLPRSEPLSGTADGEHVYADCVR